MRRSRARDGNFITRKKLCRVSGLAFLFESELSGEGGTYKQEMRSLTIRHFSSSVDRTGNPGNGEILGRRDMTIVRISFLPRVIVFTLGRVML